MLHDDEADLGIELEHREGHRPDIDRHRQVRCVNAFMVTTACCVLLWLCFRTASGSPAPLPRYTHLPSYEPMPMVGALSFP